MLCAVVSSPPSTLERVQLRLLVGVPSVRQNPCGLHRRLRMYLWIHDPTAQLG